MRIGIIGLGDIAQKAYLPVITQIEGVELVFCTRNFEVLSRLADKYRVKDFCTDYKELVGLKVDAVMIHAATKVHPEIAYYFLQHGIPTFVDKPLANSAAHCEWLYDAAEKYQQPLYVGFNRRHIPLYNQYLVDVQNGTRNDLLSLRWEKNRFNQPGEVREFIFDDFIHPLDSVNIHAKSQLSDAYVTQQSSGGMLGRLDIQWQHGNTILHASMNRQHGITSERVSANFVNESYEFDSFSDGSQRQANQQQLLRLKDWTPMLESKGFYAMIDDWITVIQKGSMDTQVIARNVASHQLAEALCLSIETQVHGD